MSRGSYLVAGSHCLHSMAFMSSDSPESDGLEETLESARRNVRQLEMDMYRVRSDLTRLEVVLESVITRTLVGRNTTRKLAKLMNRSAKSIVIVVGQELRRRLHHVLSIRVSPPQAKTNSRNRRQSRQTVGSVLRITLMVCQPSSLKLDRRLILQLRQSQSCRALP